MPTPRRRVEIALRGGRADKAPFTMYENMARQCEAEREMRNRGMCILMRKPVYRAHTPNVKVHSRTWEENGRRLTRTWYETPAGTLTTLGEAGGFTTWWHEKMFKSPEDYKALRFLLADEQYEPAYEGFARMERDFGEDAMFRAAIGGEPLQTLISGLSMSMENFCIQWMENRDEVLALYEIAAKNRRKVYPIVADSPASHANYGGNVVPEIIGPKVFEDLYVPHYNEAAEALHKRGKLVGCHFDDNCRVLAEAIASTGLDYIEAFTPSPDTDMTLAEARAAWPGKALWINFPSSVHLKSDEAVARAAFDMLDAMPSSEGVIYGITENIPEHRWRDSCRAIMDGLDRHAAERPERYAPDAG